MNRWIKYWILIGLGFCNASLVAQIPTDYSVATWQGFKTAAISYTLDDNTNKQLTVAIPIFDEFGFPTTLFTVTNWGPNWTLLQEAAVNGHEVASHTLSHPSLNTIPTVDQETELKQSQEIINSKLTGQKCLTIAYPNCNLGDLATIKKYYIAGRICSGVIVNANPSDFYNISSIIVGSQGGVKTASDFETKVKSAKSTGGWCIFLIHGIDNDGGYSPVPSSEIRTHLEFMDNSREDYWIATFLDVVRYIRERNAVKIEETNVETDLIQFIVTDDLDDAIYSTPITIKRKLPMGWTEVEIKIGDDIIPYEFDSNDNSAFFDVVPDAGSVTISKVSTNILSIDGPNLPEVFPNPFSDSLILKSSGDFSYAIYSLDGKMLYTGFAEKTISVGEELPAGTYILSVQTGNSISRIKVMKE